MTTEHDKIKETLEGILYSSLIGIETAPNREGVGHVIRMTANSVLEQVALALEQGRIKPDSIRDLKYHPAHVFPWNKLQRL